MAQKVIPTSLRLFKNKNWNSKWIVNHSIYSHFYYIDYEIRHFLLKLFNQKKIYIQNILIKYNNKNLLIYLFFSKKIRRRKNQYFNYLIKNRIENLLRSFYKIKINLYFINLNFSFIKQKDLIKKIFFLLYKLRILKRFNKKLIYLLNLVILTKNADLLSIIFFKLLRKRKYQKGILKKTTNDLSNLYSIFPFFLGYRIQFKGKLNSKNRSKKWKKQEGQIPLNTVSKQISYSMKHIKTPAGVCSIKIWLFFD